MRLGFALPQYGEIAGPDSLIRVATHAEAIGFDSLWVAERLLWPLEPHAAYPGSADGTLPEKSQSQLDPFATLTFAAAHTKRVALGSSVINIPFYPPLLLARSLTAIDVLSGGRLRVGLGNGWLPDEFDAIGVPMRGRGERADDYLEALLAIWTHSPVEVQNRHCQIPPSIILPKPIQQPHPPLYLAGFTPSALRRVARFGDGWNPSGIPVQPMLQMFRSIQQMAEQEGRDPTRLELIVRANLDFSPPRPGAERRSFTGPIDRIAADTEQMRAAGVDELLFDVQWSPGVDSVADLIACMEELRALARA